ncbi:glycosyltransferase family 39 protein [Patescibacteria group bacterium]
MSNKKKQYLYLLDYSIFTLFCFILFFKANGVLNGNEVSGIFYSLFSRLGLQYLPSIFLYGHEPARGLVELPFLFLGPNEFILRLPSLIMALISFWVIKKIVNLLTNNKLTTSIILLLYSVSGSVVLSRLTNGISGFILFTLLSVFYFLKFIKKENFGSLRKSLTFLFISILFYVDGVFLLPGILLNLLIRYRKGIFKKEIVKPFLIFFLLVFLFVFFWAAIPYFAAENGFIIKDDLMEFGFFRILKRGGSSGFDLNILKTFTILSDYNHWLFSLTSLILFFSSFIFKKGRKLGIIILTPVVYFSIHSNPTIHILHFLPLLLISACFILEKIINKVPVIVIFLAFIVVVNLNFLTRFYFNSKNQVWTWGYYLNSNVFKAAGFIIRQNSSCEEKIFSNMDAFETLFYTGLPDKKNIKISSYALIYNDKLTDSKFAYNYKLIDSFGNYINLYSEDKMEISSLNVDTLKNKYLKTYNKSSDIFPNIKCQNYR